MPSKMGIMLLVWLLFTWSSDWGRFFLVHREVRLPPDQQARRRPSCPKWCARASWSPCLTASFAQPAVRVTRGVQHLDLQSHLLPSSDAWSRGSDSCGPGYNLWSQSDEQSCSGSQCFLRIMFPAELFPLWVMPKRAKLMVTLLEFIMALDKQKLSVSSQASPFSQCKAS